MEVVREIELEADPEDVWEALTDESQLEEWFANDVELDPTPGGRGVFRWDNGETREAIVESVEEGERIVLRFDDDGVVDLRVVATDGGSLVEVRESTPSWSTAIEFRALCRMRDPVDAVFSALADPSRRFVVETLAARGSATPTELAAEPSRHPPGGRQASRRAPKRRARRGIAGRTGDTLRPDACAARVGRGLDRGGRGGVGRDGSTRSSAWSSPATSYAAAQPALQVRAASRGSTGSRGSSASCSTCARCRRSRPSGTRAAGRPSSRGTRPGRSSPSRGARSRAGRA